MPSVGFWIETHRIDYLVVECTGLADPLPIVLTFMRPELRDRVRVNSIVTIADAANFSLDLFASKAAENQLRYADTILLNKCDLASSERLHLDRRKDPGDQRRGADPPNRALPGPAAFDPQRRAVSVGQVLIRRRL